MTQDFDILDHASFVCGFGRIRVDEPAPIPGNTILRGNADIAVSESATHPLPSLTTEQIAECNACEVRR